jgi:hypothetical protein
MGTIDVTHHQRVPNGRKPPEALRLNVTEAVVSLAPEKDPANEAI